MERKTGTGEAKTGGKKEEKKQIIAKHYVIKVKEGRINRGIGEKMKRNRERERREKRSQVRTENRAKEKSGKRN